MISEQRTAILKTNYHVVYIYQENGTKRGYIYLCSLALGTETKIYKIDLLEQFRFYTLLGIRRTLREIAKTSEPVNGQDERRLQRRR